MTKKLHGKKRNQKPKAGQNAKSNVTVADTNKNPFPLLQLPDEVLSHVYRQLLPISHKYALSRTCRHLRMVFQMKHSWGDDIRLRIVPDEYPAYVEVLHPDGTTAVQYNLLKQQLKYALELSVICPHVLYIKVEADTKTNHSYDALLDFVESQVELRHSPFRGSTLELLVCTSAVNTICVHDALDTDSESDMEFDIAQDMADDILEHFATLGLRLFIISTADYSKIKLPSSQTTPIAIQGNEYDVTMGYKMRRHMSSMPFDDSLFGKIKKIRFVVSPLPAWISSHVLVKILQKCADIEEVLVAVKFTHKTADFLDLPLFINLKSITLFIHEPVNMDVLTDFLRQLLTKCTRATQIVIKLWNNKNVFSAENVIDLIFTYLSTRAGTCNKYNQFHFPKPTEHSTISEFSKYLVRTPYLHINSAEKLIEMIHGKAMEQVYARLARWKLQSRAEFEDERAKSKNKNPDLPKQVAEAFFQAGARLMDDCEDNLMMSSDERVKMVVQQPDFHNLQSAIILKNKQSSKVRFGIHHDMVHMPQAYQDLCSVG